MKNTSEKILVAALALFNSQGLAKVTLRSIAKEMNISQGNLNYHFKKRDDIIEALYDRLVSDMDESMAKIKHANADLNLIFDISNSIMNNSHKYRFFFIDFAQIMRDNMIIKKNFNALVKVRESQSVGLFGMMIENGVLRPERLTNEYYNLYKRIQIFSDFWMTSAEIERTQLEKKLIGEYLEIIMQSIYPYLTEKGIAQYNLLLL